MKKLIQVIGGACIAALAVLAVFGIYRSVVFSGLKEAGMKEANSYAGFKDTEAMKTAVSYHPVFTYTGAERVLTDAPYPVFDEIQVTDKKDDYDKTLTDAVKENRIKVQEVEVLTEQEEETQDALYNEETQELSFKRSGVYQVRIKGKDKHNNTAETKFLIPVEAHWEEEEEP